MSTALETEPTTVALGFPAQGFQNSRPRQDVDNAKFTGDSDASSHDWDLIPHAEEGRWIRRKGMTVEQNGLTEALVLYKDAPNNYKFTGRQVQQIASPAFASNQPVSWITLLTDEENAYPYGQLVYKDSEANIRRPGYNAAWSAGAPPTNVVVWPWMGGNRMQAAQDRAIHCSGSRNFLDLGGWISSPGYGGEVNSGADGQPTQWNKQYPGSADVNHRKEVIRPWSLMPPAWMPRITVGASVGASQSGIPWAGTDLFYISCFPIYRDGTWGPVATPRPPNTDLAAGTAVTDISPVDVGGYGLVRLSATTTDSFREITWNSIPYFGEGVDYVGLCRSPKVDGSLANNLPDPSDLRLVAIIRNGQSTYIDPNGNDLAITIDTRLSEPLKNPARAHVQVPRARYVGQFDGRVAVSYVRASTLALRIQCRSASGSATSDDFNTNETSYYTTREAYAEVSGTNLNLYVKGNVSVGNERATHKRVYALSSITLQQLVDRINSQRGASSDTNTTYRWHAELLPGADGTALATTLVSTAGFGDNSYTATGSTTMDGAATIAGTPTIDAMRCLASSWSGLLKVTLPSNDPQTDLHYFTRSGPNLPINAVNAFALGNNRRNPATAGACAGPILPLLKGGLVPCVRGVCWIGAEVSDADPIGVDDSVLIRLIDSERGVISPQGAAGHGFAVVLTTQGLYAYDHQGRVLNISEDLYDPSTQSGELAYEIQQCIAATALDDSSAYFNITIADNQIMISYRSASVSAGHGQTGSRPDRTLRADFSPGIEQSGVAALINPATGKFWGWGCPQIPADSIQENTGGSSVTKTIAPGAMGVVRNTDGTITWYGVRDKHDNNNGSGSTDCRMEKFNTGTSDNGSVIAPVGYSPTLQLPEHWFKCLMARIRYRKNGTGMSIAHARTKDAHANPSYFRSKNLATAGSSKWADYLWRIPRAGKGPTDACTFKISDDGSTSDRPEVWGTMFTYREVDIGV